MRTRRGVLRRAVRSKEPAASAGVTKWLSQPVAFELGQRVVAAVSESPRSWREAVECRESASQEGESNTMGCCAPSNAGFLASALGLGLVGQQREVPAVGPTEKLDTCQEGVCQHCERSSSCCHRMGDAVLEVIDVTL